MPPDIVSRLRATRVARLLLIALLPACMVAEAQETRRVLGGEHMRVLYRREHRDLAELARESGRDALGRLRRMLSVEPAGRIDVYIVGSQEEFDELTGLRNDPWVIGRAIPPERLVVVKPMGTQRLPPLLAHELAHVMLDAAMGESAGLLPRWLHEGIAQHAADEFSEDDRRTIGQAALRDELLRIEDLEAAFEGDREQVALAYAQSYTLVEYLASLEPKKGISPLLEQIEKGRDVRLALGLAFGRPVPEMEAEWLEGLRRGYGRHVGPPMSETIVGALFVLAFLLAVVVVRRRSARIRQRMEEEERLRELLTTLSGSRQAPLESEQARPEQGELPIE